LAHSIAPHKRPLVTTEQSTTNGRRKPHLRPLDRWMYGRYSAIGCNSTATLESLRAWVPRYADRMSIIYNGVPLERFQRSTAADRAQVVPTANGRKLVSFVARFDPAKDHPTLLRAIARVPEADLLLVGDGPLRPQVEALASDLGIAARVHFLGRRHDIPQLLKMSDVYVHSSNWEGFGIAAVEAMAAGLPVVATDVPGLGEIVRGAGALFPPGDDQALAGHLRRIVDSPALRNELSRASLRRAPDFSIERAVQSWIQLYEDVLSRSGQMRRQPNYAD
jgi:glycosyltransferase involved in cell wall biosynthesis